MEGSNVIARPYAKAAFAVAMAAKKLQQWSDLLDMLTLIAENSAVINFLKDPRTDWQQNAELFIDTCGKAINKENKNFINILALNGRLQAIPDIAALYEELRNAYENVIKAIVISTEKLTSSQQEKLEQALQTKLQNQVVLQYTQDETILGGLIIRIGDRVIDGSIREKLRRLKQIL